MFSANHLSVYTRSVSKLLPPSPCSYTQPRGISQLCNFLVAFVKFSDDACVRMVSRNCVLTLKCVLLYLKSDSYANKDKLSLLKIRFLFFGKTRKIFCR